MANIELAEKILKLITTKPELHDQTSWSGHGEADDPNQDYQECGTTACIAGWATILHHNLEPIKREFPATDFYNAYYTYSFSPPNGQDWDVVGRDALGIGSALATQLFLETNNEEAVAALADIVAGVDEDEVTERIRQGDYLPE